MVAEEEQSFLQRIAIAVSGCVGAVMTHFPSGLRVAASGPGGFDMSVMIERGRYVLYFGNWTEDFISEDVARRTFEAALSGDARLRVETLSGRQWRWTLERRDEDDQWIPESTVAHVIWRFWGRRETIYLRNTFPRRLPLTRTPAAR